MIKVGDKVYHVYNGNIKGVVREMRTVRSNIHLETGSASGSLYALVEVKGMNRLIPALVGDLMRDD